MATQKRLLLSGASLALFAMAAADPSVPIAYCAKINTASMNANYSMYQSDGLCHTLCSDSAFAIVQGSNCWCSDYQPADSVSVDSGECSESCPGFPDDLCGGDGLYGYMKGNKAAVGTKGASSETSDTTTSQAKPTTVENTVTLSPTTQVEITAAPDKSPTKTNSPKPSTSVATVTADGTTQLQTITVMPTVTASSGVESSPSTPEITQGPSGIGTGAAVGIAVGVLGFLVILGAIGVFFWLRRRRQQKDQQQTVERSNSGRGSSAGMMSTPRTEMASIWDSEQMSQGRRNSRLMPHDPRMDPFAGGLYSQMNKSHESINTLQDNHDYSRKVLRTTNPDPDDR